MKHKIISADDAVKIVNNGDMIAVNSSSGLCCPDALLKALGERFEREKAPHSLTTIHPIAAGDFFGSKGIEHLSRHDNMLRCVIGGSYPSGPSNAEPPAIWNLILSEKIRAYNVPSGVIFDMLREGAGKRPGVLTKVGLDTFVDPNHEGCAMNQSARDNPIVEHQQFDGEDWLYFRSLKPNIAFIRGSIADERGNISFKNEGAYLGAMEMALATHNNGGKVIAQVRHIVANGSIPAHDVHVPSVLVDYIVEAPEQLQTTATLYDPAISGDIQRPLDSFKYMEFDAAKIIARRVAQELQSGWAVNIGFGISANVPRILLEEGQHGAITWVIEQGAVGGIPLLDFKFGCSSNAEAFVASPHQFAYFQAGGFDASLLSFLQIDKNGSVNVSKLPAMPHRTAGAGGFVDITSRAKKIVFSGYFNAGAKFDVCDGKLNITKEGKIAKFVEQVDQISFSGKRALAQGQDITYITERCVIKLTNDGLLVTEIAAGIDINRDILNQAATRLKIADNVKTMDSALFKPEKIGKVVA